MTTPAMIRAEPFCTSDDDQDEGSSDSYQDNSSGDDSGGSICDRNTYDTRTKFGTVYGTANVATLAAVRAAWATYNVTTNDAKSRQALHALPAIG